MKYRIAACTFCVSIIAMFAPDRTAMASEPNLAAGIDSWRTVLDGVMGGRSSGEVSSSASGNLIFSGELSLDNNGGFSQVRTSVRTGLFDQADGVQIRVRGDGRTYNFDLRVSNARVMAGAFQQEFQTLDGQWLTIQLPFDEFRLFTFGRQVPNAVQLDPTRIESLGVTLSDKVEEEFRLEIGEIRPYITVESAPSEGGADFATRIGSGVSGAEINAAAAGLIEKAINRGAPLFNDGQITACASIYELTVESLVQMGRGNLNPDVIQRLEQGLADAATQRRVADRAWTLRRAMDDAYDRLVAPAGSSRTTSSH